MKNLLLILLTTTFLFFSLFFSCKKEDLEKDVTIRFNNSSGNFTCGEWCGTTIEIINGVGGLKSKYELPDSILDKWEWWNREYIATLKILDETCHCKDAFDTKNSNGSYPEYYLKMVEIIKIREK